MMLNSYVDPDTISGLSSFHIVTPVNVTLPDPAVKRPQYSFTIPDIAVPWLSITSPVNAELHTYIVFGLSVIVPLSAASVFFQNLVAKFDSPHPDGAAAGSCASIVTPPIVANVTVCPHCSADEPSTTVQFALTTPNLPVPSPMSMSPFSSVCATPVDDFAADSVNAPFAK